jgi:queuine tRNA-ribosyltransferase
MISCLQYQCHKKTEQARAGVLTTPHGSVNTPAFMPVGTYGTVKAMTPQNLKDVGASIILSNAYHLWIRPGHQLIGEMGGLHHFMGWDGPILTDSGGYQVFSLKNFRKISEEGVRFRSPKDGQYRMMTPEVCIEIQETLGVDMAMAFDECIELEASRDEVIRSTKRTTRWLKRCILARQKPEQTGLLGIVQGGFHDDLRVAHAQEIVELNLDAYAVGGLSVGEPTEKLLNMVSVTTPYLPENKIRYLMGVGYPWDLVEAVLRGIDLFDCVIPTRNARNGKVFTSRGIINIKNAIHAKNKDPLDFNCECYACQNFECAYLHHLFKSQEILASMLLTRHNLHFYQTLMRRIRQAILDGKEELERLRVEVWSYKKSAVLD